MKKGYDLNFEEALKMLMNKGCFLRGEDFAKGYYLRLNKENIVVLKNGNELHTPEPVLLTKGLYTQKYKAMTTATPRDIND